MAISNFVLNKIKREIQDDPLGVGYSGMTNLQKLNALNNPVSRRKVVDFLEQAPINRILSGIADTANIVDAADLQAALTST